MTVVSCMWLSDVRVGYAIYCVFLAVTMISYTFSYCMTCWQTVIKLLHQTLSFLGITLVTCHQVNWDLLHCHFSNLLVREFCGMLLPQGLDGPLWQQWKSPFSCKEVWLFTFNTFPKGQAPRHGGLNFILAQTGSLCPNGNFTLSTICHVTMMMMISKAATNKMGETEYLIAITTSRCCHPVVKACLVQNSCRSMKESIAFDQDWRLKIKVFNTFLNGETHMYCFVPFKYDILLLSIGAH